MLLNSFSDDWTLMDTGASTSIPGAGPDFGAGDDPAGAAAAAGAAAGMQPGDVLADPYLSQAVATGVFPTVSADPFAAAASNPETSPAVVPPAPEPPRAGPGPAPATGSRRHRLPAADRRRFPMMNRMIGSATGATAPTTPGTDLSTSPAPPNPFAAAGPAMGSVPGAGSVPGVPGVSGAPGVPGGAGVPGAGGGQRAVPDPAAADSGVWRQARTALGRRLDLAVAPFRAIS